MKFKKVAKVALLTILGLLIVGAAIYGIESVEDHKLDKQPKISSILLTR